ncbi:MAG: Ig-like domain-containing protein [Prolixibacteraceae bacterium]|nr:Ig-like domain-containing protein [Prolixibacteraceae bacterium]
MKKIISIIVFSGIIYLFLFYSCANVGMPTGGDKDSIPPIVVKMNPEIGARKFKGHSISVTFDEFVTSTDVSNSLVVSPVLKRKPTVRMKGKTIFIEFVDTLAQNTTYCFNFGNGIADNNEGNKLDNFRTSFSTGEDFDSLMIGGFVVMAENLEPVEDAYVMLFSEGDSINTFKKGIPSYIAKTDKKGFYIITNIKAGKYLLYALKDADYSLSFNQPDEPIAFNGSVVEPLTPNIKHIGKKDLSMVDSLLQGKLSPDSLLSGDTINVLNIDKVKDKLEPVILSSSVKGSNTDENYYANVVDTLRMGNYQERISITPNVLFMFQGETNNQLLKDYSRNKANLVKFNFSHAVKDSFDVKLISPKVSSDWDYLEYAAGCDSSINLWIIDTAVSKIDTLKMGVQYLALDTAKQTIIKRDTLFLAFNSGTYTKKEKKKKKEKKEEEQEVIQPFSFTSNIKEDFDPYDSILVESTEPLAQFDYKKIHLYQVNDTVKKELTFNVKQDTVYLRKYRIAYPWEYEEKYCLQIDSAAAKTYEGIPSAEVEKNFTVQKEKYYGKIFMNMKNISCPCILKVLKNSNDEEVINTVSVLKDGEVEIPFIKPDTYKLAIILDSNGNGKWDPGILDKKIQPEHILYYNKVIKVRSNFEIHETWSIPKNVQYKKIIFDEEKEKAKEKERKNKR